MAMDYLKDLEIQLLDGRLSCTTGAIMNGEEMMRSGVERSGISKVLKLRSQRLLW